MKIALPIIFVLLFAACATTKSVSGEKAGMTDGWYVHLDTAKTQANTSRKPILVLFTGSDWCAPCMQLEREVLSKKAFQDYAKKNLVLVKMDFPRRSPEPSIEMQVHRDTVATKYLGERQSVPTVFLLNDDGSIIAKTTFRAGGAEAYVRHLEHLLSGR
ncbi:MAG: thioredoxin family protein [Bacteroidia bacterium]